MYAIIYTIGDPDLGRGNEIFQIANSTIDADSWNPGDTGLLFKNCADEAELATEANAIDPNWRINFNTVYIKK